MDFMQKFKLGKSKDPRTWLDLLLVSRRGVTRRVEVQQHNDRLDESTSKAFGKDMVNEVREK